MEVRVARVVEHKGLSEEDAIRRILDTERARNQFCRRSFDQDVTDPCHYDLVIDTGRIPVEACAEVIATAFRGRFE